MKNSIFFIISLILFSCKGQAAAIAVFGEQQQYYDITNALPKGYKKDGSVDYTKYLQAALNKYNNVLMPNFTVSTTGLLAISNSHIKFQSNSKLKLIPTDKERYHVLAIHGVENVTVTNANIEGDLKKHKGTKGEWGFGIDIRNSQNITINNAKVTNCWGDGIIVAYGTKGFLGKQMYKTANIIISDFNISYCRRNGITVGGVNNLKIKNGTISNIKGTPPQAGIMIEPDKTKYILKNISVTNVSTSNCVTGIATNLGNYVSEIESRNFDLLIDNFTSKDNQCGVYFAGFKTLDKKKSMKGNIKISNVKTINTKKPFEHRDKYSLFPTINISNFSVDNRISNPTLLLKASYKENVYYKN
ncbi:right-handed parallel beta-helix repeat-containing protein [Flavobacterium sp. CBA20B-1]|uniref:right-handed parallel beta-helix repeat-containing protein n=1 Tax=unclassified Flavobacterium TaxID=196869 RepID=UPI0022248467|nr:MULTISPECIES: right-handed parallel beta-helix repeat-containing protein [unclassified Flavobacterium]WCM42251.1 right-handed parallel beta-helix repeat-containing protein [Flavobacterium sp. CBA20B-1]